MSGLPIIATDVRGNNEVVEENENGFLVHNNEELIEKIMVLVQEKELRKEMGRNAKKHSEKYALERVIKQMAKIYRL